MGIIDLMGNDRWSVADILNRTEAMVRSEFSTQAEAILNRKLQGVAQGSYVLTAEEQAEVGRFQQCVLAAQTAGDQAAKDAALLAATLDYEAATARLARYRLADGKPTEPIYGEPDPETGIAPVIGEVPAIDPLPATVESVDSSGAVVQVPNPLIVTDDAERAKAQQVVDAATLAVLDLAVKRSPK